ncbi:hypothetical protein ABVK25_008241 [Lepraria finkii]|uniref:AMP-dependent synthetase/ligase domain-containing protein n=1 Tax=Lepraria finkii TaxID=1340010 RepID=A0ABR4B156_9LECA
MCQPLKGNLHNWASLLKALFSIAFTNSAQLPLLSTQRIDKKYIDDLSSALPLVPRDSFRNNGPAVRAARNHKAATAECYWNGHEVALNIKDQGKRSGKGDQAVQKAQPDDIALVLRTSGTTARPKAVPFIHRNLTRTMKNIQFTSKLTSKDRTLLVMPLFHVHGFLAGFLAPFSSKVL